MREVVPFHLYRYWINWNRLTIIFKFIAWISPVTHYKSLPKDIIDTDQLIELIVNGHSVFICVDIALGVRIMRKRTRLPVSLSGVGGHACALRIGL